MKQVGQPRLMDHEYDGIQEYDNPTPGWWHLIFAMTMVFGVCYYVVAEHSPMMASIHEAWADDQRAEFRKIFGSIGELENTGPTIKTTMADARLMEVAKGVFNSNCALCHGPEAAGMPGSNCPNLTDDRWKNVKVVTDVFNVITKGANNGAMPSWENRLSSNERMILAAYVVALGEHPVVGRAPEGDPVRPWFGDVPTAK